MSERERLNPKAGMSRIGSGSGRDATSAIALQIMPAAPILARADGRALNKDAWKHPIKDAVNVAKLRNALAAYTLRHSAITDLIRGGLPALTLEQLSGTSVAMIERHYGHLVRNDAQEALATLSL
jgi:site-specific recombinase XerD